METLKKDTGGCVVEQIDSSTPTFVYDPSLGSEFESERILTKIDRRQKILPENTAVGRLKSIYDTKCYSLGTGTLLGASKVLTAAHCCRYFSEDGAVHDARKFEFQINGKTYYSDKSSIYKEYSHEKDYQSDLALITLSGNEKFNNTAFVEYGDIILPPKAVSGYPGELADNVLIGMSDRPSVVGELMHYKIDTTPGQSGAPVFDTSQWSGEIVRTSNLSVLAVHVRGLGIKILPVC